MFKGSIKIRNVVILLSVAILAIYATYHAYLSIKVMHDYKQFTAGVIHTEAIIGDSEVREQFESVKARGIGRSMGNVSEALKLSHFEDSLEGVVYFLTYIPEPMEDQLFATAKDIEKMKLAYIRENLRKAYLAGNRNNKIYVYEDAVVSSLINSNQMQVFEVVDDQVILSAYYTSVER